MEGGLLDCPCCHLPTLSERGGYEICGVCLWEDDGQNNHDADEVRGGPNGSYSLTDARKNYFHHGHMYAAGEGISAVERPSKARRELMNYLATLTLADERLDLEKFYQLLNDADRLNDS